MKEWQRRRYTAGVEQLELDLVLVLPGLKLKNKLKPGHQSSLEHLELYGLILLGWESVSNLAQELVLVEEQVNR